MQSFVLCPKLYQKAIFQSNIFLHNFSSASGSQKLQFTRMTFVGFYLFLNSRWSSIVIVMCVHPASFCIILIFNHLLLVFTVFNLPVKILFITYIIVIYKYRVHNRIELILCTYSRYCCFVQSKNYIMIMMKLSAIGHKIVSYFIRESTVGRYLFTSPIAWHIPGNQELFISRQVWPDFRLLSLSPLPGRALVHQVVSSCHKLLRSQHTRFLELWLL